MSFKPYTEKLRRKKLEFPETDPHQNDTDPKH